MQEEFKEIKNKLGDGSAATRAAISIAGVINRSATHETTKP